MEYIDMHVSVEEIRPLPGGYKYEAKVLKIYENNGGQRQEVSLPKGDCYWGFAWGKTREEARQKAQDQASSKRQSL